MRRAGLSTIVHNADNSKGRWRWRCIWWALNHVVRCKECQVCQEPDSCLQPGYPRQTCSVCNLLYCATDHLVQMFNCTNVLHVHYYSVHLKGFFHCDCWLKILLHSKHKNAWYSMTTSAQHECTVISSVQSADHHFLQFQNFMCSANSVVQ